MRLLLALVVYGFYINALGGLAAPFLAAEFKLDDAAITAIAGWIAIGAFGTAVATRLAGSLRPPPCAGRELRGNAAAGAALGAGVRRPQLRARAVGVNALLGALVTTLAVMVAEQSSDLRRASGQAWFGIFASFGGAVALIVGALVPSCRAVGAPSGVSPRCP